jgi:DNA-binding NarL/FixJ family response regulator
LISIIIVDDRRLLREGLQTLLQTEEGFGFQLKGMSSRIIVQTIRDARTAK